MRNPFSAKDHIRACCCIPFGSLFRPFCAVLRPSFSRICYIRFESRTRSAQNGRKIDPKRIQQQTLRQKNRVDVNTCVYSGNENPAGAFILCESTVPRAGTSVNSFLFFICTLDTRAARGTIPKANAATGSKTACNPAWGGIPFIQRHGAKGGMRCTRTSSASWRIF